MYKHFQFHSVRVIKHTCKTAEITFAMTQQKAIADLTNLDHILLLLLVWQAPLGVRSAKRRHQSPEWTILSHSYRLIQGEIV